MLQIIILMACRWSSFKETENDLNERENNVNERENNVNEKENDEAEYH